MYENDLTAYDKKTLASVAVISNDDQKSGSYILKDAGLSELSNRNEGLELLPIAEALQKYDQLREKYFGRLESRGGSSDSSGISAGAALQGFFLRVMKGQKIALPVQAALYLSQSGTAQHVRNLIIIEEDAGLELITGCACAPELRGGEHRAVTETYVGKKASFLHTMIHSWGPHVQVRPHAFTLVEEGGRYVSNYVSLRPASDMISEPVTWLEGEKASAKYFSIVLGSQASTVTLGGDVFLQARGTSAEIAHRAVCTGGQIIQKGLLIGEAECRAHVDCAGMLISGGEEGYIQSVPGLFSRHPEAQMSHEASIGRIAPQEVQYLMAHGMEEREAVSMLVRGFLDTDIRGIGPELERRIGEIAELAGHGED